MYSVVLWCEATEDLNNLISYRCGCTYMRFWVDAILRWTSWIKYFVSHAETTGINYWLSRSHQKIFYRDYVCVISFAARNNAYTDNLIKKSYIKLPPPWMCESKGQPMGMFFGKNNNYVHNKSLFIPRRMVNMELQHWQWSWKN